MRNVFSILIFLILFLGGVEVFMQEYSKEELISQKEKIEREIELTNRLIEDTRGKKSNSLSELKLIRSKLIQRNKLIAQLSSEIESINTDIIENTATLQSLEIDLKRVKNEYASLIYHSYKNKNADLNLMYLLASDDINQFYLRVKYLQQYKDYRIKQINLIRRLNRVIELKIGDLARKKQSKVQLINKQLVERASLRSEEDENKRIISILSQKESSLKKDLDDKKKIAQRLQKEIEEFIKKEAERNKFSRLTPEERIISTDFSQNRGRLPWPLEQGIVTERFGEHQHAILKNLTIRNNGIDISSVPNSAVRAIFKGSVSKVFSIKGANTTVIIRHGNYYTVYHNLINVRVKVGDIVNTKQYIGDVFTDVKNGESVLHFEIWEELEKQNPEDWLSN